MPSALIHIQTGKYFCPEADVKFFVGTIAPDCTRGRQKKDRLHLRTSRDRNADLKKLRDGYFLEDSFQMGTLLHLFTDMLWDGGPQEDFHRLYPRDTNEWFLPYRRQISIASAYMFNGLSWAMPLWERMLNIDNSQINSVECFPPYEIKRYLEYGYWWHTSNLVGPSTVYTPESVDRFCRSTANLFKEWLKS